MPRPAFQRTILPSCCKKGGFDVARNFDGHVRRDKGPVILVIGIGYNPLVAIQIALAGDSAAMIALHQARTAPGKA